MAKLPVKRLILFTDGGSRGNQRKNRPASRRAAGAMILSDGENILHRQGWYLGPISNNQAEYTALIHGMEYIIEGMNELHASAGIRAIELICISDSQLMIRQMNGEYRVRNPDIRSLHNKVRSLADQLRSGGFSHVLYVHAPRDHVMISKADKILNDVLDKEARKNMRK